MSDPNVKRNRERAVRTMVLETPGRIVTEPEEGELAEARSLYNACIRWAYRKVRHVEAETEKNWNAPWYVAEEEAIERQFERLNERLASYGLRLYIPSMWAQLAKAEPRNRIVDGNVRLYYYND